jgi:hypothetical protein
VSRIWAPVDPGRTRIRYLVPSSRVARRLRSYGVPDERITFTGFPLPDELVGGPSLPLLKQRLAERIVRLDPSGEFRRSMPEELGVTLVAGVRPEVEARFREAIHHARMEPLLGGALEILSAPTFAEYYARFNALLARADVLWTKPSELVFYGALGIPLVLAPPVGVHEWYNRRWARDAGAGLKQREARFAAEWISDWLADGVLAAAAWAGYMRLPKFGLYRILEAVGLGPRTAPGT